MKAVVMAGGEGSRLRPLTQSRPKPLAPVANKPVMEHIVDLLKRHGVTEIVATVHYLADEVEAYFGEGIDFGISMSYAVEDTPLGTAGAVKMAEERLDETFVVMSGDALTDVDLTAVLEAHRSKQAAATIVLKRVENPLEFGVVILDDDGLVRRFLEKPTWSEVFSDTINTGIYVLEPEIFGLMERGRIYDFSKDVFPQLLERGRPVHGFVTGDYWTDIGNLQQYREANYDALAGRCRLELPGRERTRGVHIGAGASVAPGAIITGPVVIGKNADIRDGAVIESYTCVGDGCIVESYAQLASAVVWNDAYVGKRSKLSACTVAEHVIIKDDVTVGEGVVIGARCTLDAGAQVRPHVKLWPDKFVSAGSVVSMSLVWGTKWPGSLFGGEGVKGIANIEITPEFALKLGQAYGSFFEPHAVVMTSRDTHHATRMINRCLISGLMSVGCDVHDLRTSPIPLARYEVRSEGAGGIHVRVHPDDPNNLLIELFGAGGTNLDKNGERKVENLFFRGDFRRTAMDDVGYLSFPERALDRYNAGFLKSLNVGQISDRAFKVVVDYAYGNAATTLPHLLSKLNIEMVALNAYLDDAKVRRFLADRVRYLYQLSTIVPTLGADIGIMVEPGAENVSIVDDTGRIAENDLLLAVVAELVFAGMPGAVVAVPVTASALLDDLAAKHGGRIIRTKADRRSMMELCAGPAPPAFAGGAREGLIFPEFSPAFDAIYASAKILELLAHTGKKASELIASVPPLHIVRRKVICPWERKGVIMRELISQSRDRKLDLLDGVKIVDDGTWVLVLPDPSDPLFTVVAEAGDDTEAARLADDYVARIKTLVDS
jgi:mannose-1-phosphate guanylyltransferase/phosphomannomutase